MFPLPLIVPGPGVTPGSSDPLNVPTLKAGVNNTNTTQCVRLMQIDPSWANMAIPKTCPSCGHGPCKYPNNNEPPVVAEALNNITSGKTELIPPTNSAIEILIDLVFKQYLAIRERDYFRWIELGRLISGLEKEYPLIDSRLNHSQES